MNPESDSILMSKKETKQAEGGVNVVVNAPRSVLVKIPDMIASVATV